MTTGSIAAPNATYRVFHYSMIAVVVSAILVCVVATGIGVRQHFQSDPNVTSVRGIADGVAVSGGSLHVTRADDGVDFSLTSSRLPRGHVVTVRAMVFNHPEHCAHGERQLRCGEADLVTPGVDGSLVLIGAQWLRNTDKARFEGTLSTKDETKKVVGDGLTNPQGANITFVILDHGEPDASRYSEQLQTFRGACTQPANGEPGGPVACADLQYAASER
jgi:hypothetical protein